MKLGRKDYTIAVKTGTDANKAKFKKECVQGEIYHATDTGFFYIAEVTAGLNDATLSQFGTSAFSSCSVSFDGTDDYINIPHDSAFNITGSITISAWFKLDSNTKYMSFLTKRASGAIAFQFYNTLTGGGFDGNLRFAPGDGSGYSGSSQIPTGSWNHGAIVVDSGTYTFYLNGSADGTGSLTLNNTNSADLTIGRLGDTANYGDGKVDEVAIFNTALSASDVAALRDTSGSNPVPANISSLNPVGWWRMGDGSDGSGNADGTLVNIGGTDFPQIYNVATDGSGNRITGIDGSMTNIASPNGIVTDVPS